MSSKFNLFEAGSAKFVIFGFDPTLILINILKIELLFLAAMPFAMFFKNTKISYTKYRFVGIGNYSSITYLLSHKF